MTAPTARTHRSRGRPRHRGRRGGQVLHVCVPELEDRRHHPL